MTTHKYHMRIVAQQLDVSNPIVLGGDVCIDVVLRGTDKNDIDLVAIQLKEYFDMYISGHWAGIGRGEYVDKPEIILG